MNAHIFKHECRTRLGSVATWSAALITMLLVFFSFFPVFAEQAAAMNQLMDNFPPELRAAFGMGALDMSTVAGYFSFIFLFIQLCLAIQAANYGVGLVSIEETELTADFLLTRPVSRASVMTSKLLAALACLTVTNLVVWAGSFAAIELFRDGRGYDRNALLLLLLTIVIFQLFFLGVGLVISLLVRRVRSVTPFGLGLAFGAYVLNAFSGIFGDVKLELITPFKHLDPGEILTRGALNTPLVLLNLAVSALAIGVSYWLYLRRDIPAVS